MARLAVSLGVLQVCDLTLYKFAVPKVKSAVAEAVLLRHHLTDVRSTRNPWTTPISSQLTPDFWHAILLKAYARVPIWCHCGLFGVRSLHSGSILHLRGCHVLASVSILDSSFFKAHSVAACRL